MFTDKEHRILLSAMARELEVCKQVDKEVCREPYEETLESVYKSINRKIHDIQHKYKWHDLRENPADLPNEAGEYLVFAPLYEQISADCFDDTPKYSVQPFCMMANGMHWLGDVCDDEVWLWKEIEPLEGGNEDDK